jgi:hypothetical protein
MIDKTQLRDYIIKPVLLKLNLYSESAVNLLMGTAAQESRMGTYLKQLGAGPALGIFQMEPATHTDLWNNFLKYKPALAEKVLEFKATNKEDEWEMVGNLYYAAAMARIHYFRVKAALPGDANDVKALARFWKKYYNTVLGAGTEEEFIANYKKYVA